VACMEHDCAECGATWHDNQRHPACPKCGSTNVSSHFDEYPEREMDYDREDEEC
jgi:predicted  nucleic acid-binding Zn-ribbon protein